MKTTTGLRAFGAGVMALVLIAAVASAASAQARVDVSPSPAPASTDRSVPARAPAATAPNVSVSIPEVAFTARVAARHNRLRTPVLVNIGAPAGKIVVEGAARHDRCAADATPGVVTWLDCPLAPGRPGATIVVTLEDGTTVEQAVQAG